VDARRLEASTDGLRGAGLSVQAVAIDVGDTNALSRAMHAATTRSGRLDVVFANAGISAGPGFGAADGKQAGTLQRIDTAHWNHVIAINLTSVMHTIRISAAQMKDQGYGRIIVTASIAGLRAEPFVNYAYAVAKAGVVNLVRQAAVELASSGVAVNAIAPGFIHTDIGGGRLNDPMVRAELAEGVPIGRVGEAAEICGLALYLASPACSYTTGVVIPVDGGLTAR
jgi:NAD(P)-dependent dehydrogenase (short-subunit alcohol dehydrogenase family)